MVALEDIAQLPDMLRAAERLAALDGAGIVLLLIAADEERLAQMDGEARLVVEAREGVRIQWAAVARGEAAVIAETLRRLSGGMIICQFGGLVVPDAGRPAGRWPPCWSARCSSCAEASEARRQPCFPRGLRAVIYTGAIRMRSATLLSRATELRLRVAEILEACTARVTARRAELAAAVALTLLFLIAGGLSLRVALLGLVAAVALAAFRPIDESAGGAGGRTLGQAGADADRLWRMVIDAVPEPAVALDASGRIVHANRLTEEQFGARRRDGHIASHEPGAGTAGGGGGSAAVAPAARGGGAGAGAGGAAPAGHHGAAGARGRRRREHPRC